MDLKIDDFLARLNRRGTLNPVIENTKKPYRNSLGVVVGRRDLSL